MSGLVGILLSVLGFTSVVDKNGIDSMHPVIMYKLKNVLPIHILKILYYRMILPYLSYGILAWGASSARLRLFSLQKKAIRLITNSRLNAHTEPLFKALNLLKLKDIHK